VLEVLPAWWDTGALGGHSGPSVDHERSLLAAWQPVISCRDQRSSHQISYCSWGWVATKYSQADNSHWMPRQFLAVCLMEIVNQEGHRWDGRVVGIPGTAAGDFVCLLVFQGLLPVTVCVFVSVCDPENEGLVCWHVALDNDHCIATCGVW